MVRYKEIAVFAKSFPPNFAVSSFRISSYCKALLDDGWKVKVFTQKLSNTSPSLLDRYVSGVARYETNSTGKLSQFLFYLKSVFRLTFFTRVRLVLMTGGPFYYFFLTPLLKALGFKIILDFRDPWCLRPEFKLRRYKLLRVIEFLAIRYSDSVILVNEFVSKFYSEKYSKYKAKFRVIENGYFELPESTQLSESLSARASEFLNEFEEPVVAFFPGKLIYRDLSNFLKVLRANQKLVLFKVGPREDKFEYLVDRYGVSKKVLDFGLVSYEDSLLLARKFANFSLLITSNYTWEATTKVFDGLQFSIPTLALTPSNSYAHRVLRETDSGIRCENSKHSIMEAIPRLLSSRFSFEGYKSYERIEQGKNMRNIANELLKTNSRRD